MSTRKIAGSLKYSHEMTFEGKGVFPYDMLRYDACFPKMEKDALALRFRVDLPESAAREGTWRVTVVRYTETKDPRWTIERWQSFGWRPVVGA